MARRYVIIPAGGSGTRMGLPYPKQLLALAGSTVIEQTLDLFGDLPVWVAVPQAYFSLFKEKLKGRAELVIGGATRFQSVRNAFEAIQDIKDEDLICIHDAARPFLDTSNMEQAWTMAAEKGAIIYANKAVDTMKQVRDGRIQTTLDREQIYHAQTPQIFRAALLRTAYQAAGAEVHTDEAGLLESQGTHVYVFPASPGNRKITHREDLTMLDPSALRIGNGYDVHRYDPNRPLYLCGIHLPEGPGLLGHSDADVALHAFIDALLGAAGEGDIGHWFPDDDPTLKGIRSTVLLERVWTDLRGKKFQFVNGDITIQAQVPKLAPHIGAMRSCIAQLMGTSADRVNVKATTTEGLGFVGRKEGMAASAVVMLTAGA